MANRYAGLGRVWVNENDFTSSYLFDAQFRDPVWTEAVFIGVSLTRFLSLYGHVVEAIYREQPPARWRDCYFIVADPQSEYVQAHARSALGRPETPHEIEASIVRVREIREAVARHWQCDSSTVPLILKTTRSQIRWGLYYFGDKESIVTMYRFGSRSYFNPRLEILHHQPGGRASTPLGEWIENYIALVKDRSDQV
jgi:hypothetical protein